MSVQPILPISGVPDELIRVLNDRFRSITEAAPAAAVATPSISPAPSSADSNIEGVYRIQGTQVVGTRKPALTAASPAVVGTAGVTYGVGEQGLINSLITLTTNLRARLIDLENRLAAKSGHGLIG